MKISCNPEKDIRLSNNPNSNRLATVSITLNDEFVVRGLSVMNGSKGIFVNMPNVSYTDQMGEKRYADTAFPTTKELRDEISNVVIGAYSTLMKKLRANANTAENTPDFEAPSFDEPER